jgi:hypothetical protein
MTARTSARALALLAGAVLVLAACGPGGTASSSPAATTAAVATPAPAETGGGLFPSFDLGSFALPSFNRDVELEGLLPDTIAGKTVQKFSMTGDSYMGTGGTGTEEVDAVLDQAGKTAADLSVAFGGTNAVTLIAYRIKGVPADTFFQAFLAAAQQDGETTVTDAGIGGKSVKKVVSTDSELGTAYVYASGDVLFTVVGAALTDAILQEAFSQLP